MPVKRNRGRRKSSRSRKRKYRRRRIGALLVLLLIIVSIAVIIDNIRKDDDYKSVGNNPKQNINEGTNKNDKKDNEKASGDKDKLPLKPGATFNERDWNTKEPKATPEKTGNTENKTEESKKDKEAKQLEDKFNAILYYPDEDFNALDKVSVSITYKYNSSDDEESIRCEKLKQTLKALISGESSKIKRTVIPPGTSVLDVVIDDNMAIVNLTEEFYKNQDNSSLAVRLSIGQLILTCGEQGFDVVLFKINGETILNYPEGVDLSNPLNKSDYLGLVKIK